MIEPVDPLSSPIPRTLVRFWHNELELPDDVRACMASWDRLTDEGFVLRSFDDAAASSYIETYYGRRERAAFARCEHPAMRCDYLRMCVLLAEGGLYVDADDVLLGDGWKLIFRNDRMKVQPLCYDITAGGMMASADIWRTDLPAGDRVFYVNNDPIAAPAGHPILQQALKRATDRLLGSEGFLEIQATTGPGNLTAALAAHARQLQIADQPFDFELIRDWDAIAEMRWSLSYRDDERNWRNVYGC
ncbi:glycosyltransferase [Mesorhizobium sp.]|uniref:glycosyltransferase family 32 protein n=1 Tax=Mesorhizobium sp. TaxID=1871066 RepID=UPI00257B2C58|nr:glycosyltransferase [Mesorhizobium sp.]